MKGFLAGSLALIVLYVALQPGTANKADTASGVLVSGIRHLLSGDFAAVPDRGAQRNIGRTTTTSAPAPSTGGSGPGVATPPPGTVTV